MRVASFMAGAFAWELGNPHCGKATPATFSVSQTPQLPPPVPRNYLPLLGAGLPVGATRAGGFF